MIFPMNGPKAEFMPGQTLNLAQPMRRPLLLVVVVVAVKLVGVLKRTAIAGSFLMPLPDLGRIENVG